MDVLLLESTDLDVKPVERSLVDRGHRVIRVEEAARIPELIVEHAPVFLLVPDDSRSSPREIGAGGEDGRERPTPVVLVTSAPGEATFRRWADAIDDWIAPDGPEMEARLDWLLTRARGSDGSGASRSSKESNGAGRPELEMVAEFGLYALRHRDLRSLLGRGVAVASEVIDAPLVAYLERRPGEDRFRLREGVGWRPGLAGHAAVEDDPETTVGYAFRARSPVQVAYSRAEKSERGPSALERDAGVDAALAVPVESAEGPSGVLLVADRRERRFTPREKDLALQIANVLGETLSRRRTEKALSESEAHARAVLENTVEGIIGIDAEGTVLSYNRAATRIFGYESEEVVGRNVSMLMPEPYRDEHDDYIQRYLETGERRIIGVGREVRGLRKDGSTFPMHLSVSEVRVGDDLLFTGLVRDVSERRRLEREIINISEEERQRLGQELHDGLGQTLNAIALFADTVADELEREGRAEAEEVDRIAALVREADEEARQLARGLVPVDASRESLSSALERLTEKLDDMYGAEVTFRTTEVRPEHLPEGPSANHLYRIAQEAAANAARHGDPERIELVLIGTEEHVRLQVRDDGSGFDHDATGGEGLGLRTMEYRARIAGGDLSVSSVPGHGTTITCTVGTNHSPKTREESGTSDPGGCPVDHG